MAPAAAPVRGRRAALIDKNAAGRIPTYPLGPGVRLCPELMATLQGKNIIITGGSRGLGRGMVDAVTAAGASVVAVARGRADLDRMVEANPSVRGVAGDVAEPRFVLGLLQREPPDALILNAGASPLLRPLHQQTWDTFSQNWNVDVRAAFTWLRDALVLPLAPKTEIIVVSSGAALRGSPLSGGYAGAKKTVAFIADYARGESERLGLGLRIRTLFPQLNPNTALGRAGVEAYAKRAGLPFDEFAKRFDPPLSPEVAGAAVVQLLSGSADDAATQFMLTGRGLSPLPA